MKMKMRRMFLLIVLLHKICDVDAMANIATPAKYLQSAHFFPWDSVLASDYIYISDPRCSIVFGFTNVLQKYSHFLYISRNTMEIVCSPIPIASYTMYLIKTFCKGFRHKLHPALTKGAFTPLHGSIKRLDR